MAWGGLGAYVGLFIFAGTCLLFDGFRAWLNDHEGWLGSREGLPFMAIAWLAFATAGAVVFTRVWSIAMGSVARRRNLELR
jgi:hypothetical protein